MGVTVKRTTKGPGLQGAQKELNKLLDIKVGVLSGTGEHTNADSGQTLAEIAFWNEFGTKWAPARPFLRVTIRENRHLFKRMVKRLYGLIIKGKMRHDQAQKILGAKAAALVQKKIVQLQSPPNAPRTVELKGSTNPLVDTGELKNSISWEVVK
jgi:hypothetical protein